MDASVDSHSQLESLFLKFLSLDYYTIMSSLWIWLAVFTTAISFWRMRTTTSSHSTPRNSDDDSPSFHHQQPQAKSRTDEDRESAAAACASLDVSFTRPSICDDRDGVDGTTKGKLTITCLEDQDNEVEEIDSSTYVREQLCKYSNQPCGFVYVWKNIRDISWYSSQDLSALNGSIVKLWDDGRRRGRFAYLLAI